LPGGVGYPLDSIAEFQSFLHLIPPAQASPGALKTVGGFRKTRYRGLERVDFAGYLVAAAYNLVRLVRLTSQPTLG
jgi:IS5 family transposase